MFAKEDNNILLLSPYFEVVKMKPSVFKRHLQGTQMVSYKAETWN